MHHIHDSWQRMEREDAKKNILRAAPLKVWPRFAEPKRKPPARFLRAVGLEPTSTNTSQLECDPLDHSGKRAVGKQYELLTVATS